jgi:hypothetical protein
LRIGVPSADGDYLFETAFDYGEYDLNTRRALDGWNFRADAFPSQPGFELHRLCRRVLQWHRFALPAALVQSLDLSCDTSR